MIIDTYAVNILNLIVKHYTNNVIQAQFFPPATYQRFNMFNSHFFSGRDGKAHLSQFLATEPSNVAFILDPPFGGIADILASTVKTLWKFAMDCVTGTMDGEFPTFWVFPYFLEGHVTKAMPRFNMLDYKVSVTLLL